MNNVPETTVQPHRRDQKRAGVLMKDREEASVRKQIDGTLYTHSIDRRVLIRAAIGAAMLVPHAAYAQGAAPVGSVKDVKGEAFAETRAERRTLAREAPLFINDLVGTGSDSRLRLHLGRDTTLRIGQQARLTIDRFLVNAGGEITVRSGPILFDRPAEGRPARIQIRTPFALIAVRGTRFSRVRVRCLWCVRRAWQCCGFRRGSPGCAPGGQGTNLARPGAAPTPPAPWKPERIRAALESVA